MLRYFFIIKYIINNKNGLNKTNIISILFIKDTSSFHSNVHIFLKYFSNITINFDS
jgi:hypothetical protein